MRINVSEVVLVKYLNLKKRTFGKGSKAGKELATRKKEKSFIQTKIDDLERKLMQPDLFETIAA